MKNYTIDNKFIIMESIGKGAFSEVYKVKRLKDHQIYALKKVTIKNLKKKEI